MFLVTRNMIACMHGNNIVRTVQGQKLHAYDPETGKSKRAFRCACAAGAIAFVLSSPARPRWQC